MRSCPANSVNPFAQHLLRLYSPKVVRQVLSPALTWKNPLAISLSTDPGRVFRSMGMTPDPWQEQFLLDPAKRRLMLCCRRAGKTIVSAAKTLVHCLTEPNRACLVFSPTRRQSQEYIRYVTCFDSSLGYPVKVTRRSLSEVEWANGSRLISLPDSQEGIVGVGGNPTRLVVDEASRVSDILYMSMRPMLALGAELEVLSTPFGKRGWFFGILDSPQRLSMFRSWRVTAHQCPRITPEFLEEEFLELGERWYNQDYNLTFSDAVDAVFSADIIEGGREDGIIPLF